MTLSEYLERPGVTAIGLARAVGVSHTTVARWAAPGGQVPHDKLVDVCRETGLNAAALRPDLARMFSDVVTA